MFLKQKEVIVEGLSDFSRKIQENLFEKYFVGKKFN